MYLTNYEMIEGAFKGFGFPTWIIYPLAYAKILGVLAVWIPGIPRWLKEWAYAGFFFDALLAFGAHHYVNDGGELFSILALVFVTVSRFFWDRKDWAA